MEATVEVDKKKTNIFQDEQTYNSEPVEPNEEIFTQEELDRPIINEEPVLDRYRESIVVPEAIVEESIEKEAYMKKST